MNTQNNTEKVEANQKLPAKTRVPSLGYIKDAPGLWRFVDLTDNSHQRVGPQYKTKMELLCDLERYNSQIWGG